MKFVFSIEIFLWVDSVNYNVQVFFFLQNYTKCIEYRMVGVHLQWVEPVSYVPSQNSRLVPCHVNPGPGRLVTLRIMVSTRRCGQFVYHLCPCNCVIKQYIQVYILSSQVLKKMNALRLVFIESPVMGNYRPTPCFIKK